MRLYVWIDVTLIAGSLILLQIVDQTIKCRDVDPFYDDVADDFCTSNSFSERVVYVLPKLYKSLVNNFGRFVRLASVLLKKSFFDVEMISLENLALCTELFNVGHELRWTLWEMLGVFFETFHNYDEFTLT